MRCHFQSSLLSLKRQSFPLISEHHLKSSSSSTAGCDQTKRGRPGILRASLSCLGTEMRSISTEGTVCTVVVHTVHMCIRVCGVSCFRLPCSPPPFFNQTFQSGRPNRESLEPLKSVINKMVRGTCMGSDPGSLL